MSFVLFFVLAKMVLVFVLVFFVVCLIFCYFRLIYFMSVLLACISMYMCNWCPQWSGESIESHATGVINSCQPHVGPL